MAGQTVISRNKKTTNSSNGTGPAAGTNHRTISASSPVKNPFKSRSKQIRSNNSPLVKCVIVACICCGLLAWTTDLFSVSSSRDNSDLGSGASEKQEVQPQLQNLRLRPDYLTDDGKEDESADSDGGADDGESAEEEDADADAATATSAGDDEIYAPTGRGEGNEDAGNSDKGNTNDKDKDNDKVELNEEDEEEPKVRLRSPSLKDDHKHQQHGRRRQNQKIPNILIFTHYKNLLELLPKTKLMLETDHDNNQTDPGDADADADAHSSASHPLTNFTPDELEELTLAVNVQHSIDIHNRSSSKEDQLQVLFWTDQDCIESLQRTRPTLVPHFETEREGMYKADICRGTALLEHGGFYLDVDVGVRHDLWKDLRPDTKFVTAKVHQASNWVHKGFFQAILGASPHNPVLKRYLELFEMHYDGRAKIKKGPLGVLLLKRAWDQIQSEHEKNPNQTAIAVPTELYQELLYHENGILDSGKNKGVLFPAPTWGKRRACHFVVAGIANDPSNVELVLETGSSSSSKKGDEKKREIGLQIPVLSRIPGSRMCAGFSEEPEASTKKGNNSKIRRFIESMRWWERT